MPDDAIAEIILCVQPYICWGFCSGFEDGEYFSTKINGELIKIFDYYLVSMWRVCRRWRRLMEERTLLLATTRPRVILECYEEFSDWNIESEEEEEDFTHEDWMYF